jgi:hypothetical protein
MNLKMNLKFEEKRKRSLPRNTWSPYFNEPKGLPAH